MYTKNIRVKRLIIKTLNVAYSYLDYKRLGLNSHYETALLNGYSEAYIDLNKTPILVNGKLLK